MRLKVSSAKRRPFSLGLNVLIVGVAANCRLSGHPSVPFYKYGTTGILGWIRNNTYCFIWDVGFIAVCLCCIYSLVANNTLMYPIAVDSIKSTAKNARFPPVLMETTLPLSVPSVTRVVFEFCTFHPQAGFPWAMLTYSHITVRAQVWIASISLQYLDVKRLAISVTSIGISICYHLGLSNSYEEF